MYYVLGDVLVARETHVEHGMNLPLLLKPLHREPLEQVLPALEVALER